MDFNHEFVRIGEHLLPFLGPLPVDDGQFGRLLSSRINLKSSKYPELLFFFLVATLVHF